MQKTWVRPLGWEDPLKEGMATHSGILAWRISRNRGAWQATVHGVARVGYTKLLCTEHTLLSHKKECILACPNEVDEPRSYYTE